MEFVVQGLCVGARDLEVAQGVGVEAVFAGGTGGCVAWGGCQYLCVYEYVCACWCFGVFWYECECECDEKKRQGKGGGFG